MKGRVIDWLFKHRNYTKFIVLTRARTGSNLLINSLQSHPNTRVFGEIFRGGADASTKEAVLHSAEHYFRRRIFSHYPRSIHAVGFKIFYHHPVWDPGGGVWRYLQALPELRVIHLKRRNLLRTLVSAKIAKKTDIWKQTAESGAVVDKRIALSPEECIQFFENVSAQESEADRKFASNRLLQLSYEDLVSAYDRQMNIVEDFLGVKPVPLPPRTIKQNPEPLSAVVLNYEELKHALSGTQWKGFTD